MVDWFDYWLKDAPTRVLSRAPVRLFVMGANTWRDEQEWPLARAAATPFYFHSGGKANTLNGDETLSQTDGPAKAGHYGCRREADDAYGLQQLEREQHQHVARGEAAGDADQPPERGAPAPRRDRVADAGQRLADGNFERGRGAFDRWEHARSRAKSPPAAQGRNHCRSAQITARKRVEPSRCVEKSLPGSGFLLDRRRG